MISRSGNVSSKVPAQPTVLTICTLEYLHRYLLGELVVGSIDIPSSPRPIPWAWDARRGIGGKNYLWRLSNDVRYTMLRVP